MLYRTLIKVPGTNTKKVYVVTPRCAAAAAAVVSAVVLRQPTKEYTHPYSMMHRRLTTAGIEVAPHYRLLLVVDKGNETLAAQVYSSASSWTLPYRFIIVS